MKDFECLICNVWTLIVTNSQVVQNAGLKNKMCNNLQVYVPLHQIHLWFEVSFW